MSKSRKTMPQNQSTLQISQFHSPVIDRSNTQPHTALVRTYRVSPIADN